jgi:hypothetical protein
VARALAGPTLAGFCIIAGGYNMILPVCLAPAGGWLLAQGWMRRDGRGVVRVCAMLFAMLAVCALLFWTRFAGLVERFSLFEQYNFGWPVPRLTPEGWFGLVSDAALNPWPGPARAFLLVIVLAGWLIGIGWLWRGQRARALVALMFIVPLAAGWAILDHEARVRANASYDAYKLLAVFQGELLIGLGGWFVLLQGRRGWGQLLARGLAAAALIGTLVVGAQFRRNMAQAPLRVDRSLLDLGAIENDPRIASLNIRVEDFWARMWANTFLLRKPQYFVTHSYEGRLDTPLRGEWDLSDSLARSIPPGAEDFIVINERFHLVRAGAYGQVRMRFADGWYEPERRGESVWRWTSGDARLSINNPAATEVRIRLTLKAQAITPRQVQVSLNGTKLGALPIGTVIGSFDLGEVLVPPGESMLELQPAEAARAGENGDARLLSVAVHEMTLQGLPRR